MNLELFFSFKVMFFPGEFNTCSVFQSTCCKYSSSLATPFCIYLFLPLYISKLVNIKCDLSYIFFFPLQTFISKNVSKDRFIITVIKPFG